VERVNQSDLTAGVAKKLGLPMTTTKEVVDNFVGGVQSALLMGRKVNLSGFVILGVRRRRPRTGRNPKSGDPVNVPAGRKLFMKTSKKFKEDLDKPKPARKTTPAKKAAPKKAVTKKKAAAKVATKSAAPKKRAAKKAPAKKRPVGRPAKAPSSKKASKKAPSRRKTKA